MSSLFGGSARKIGPLALGFLLVVGLGTLAISGSLFVSQRRFLATAVSAKGTVVDLETRRSSGRSGGSSTSYYPVVEFVADGETVRFTGGTGTAPPAFDRGEAVTVRYLPGTPEQARIDAFSELWLGSLVTGLIGAIFVLIGAGGFFWMLRERRRHAWLRQNGQRVQAEVTSCALDRSYAVNGRNPYRVYAQWQDPTTRLMHLFKSEMVWFDPAPFVKTKTVDVLIDPAKPSIHLMDTSFLPQEA